MSNKPLTSKQDAFVKEYILNNGNATQAASKAGYKGNKATLQKVGYENLLKPLIAKAIESHREMQKEKFSVSFEEKQRMLVMTFDKAHELGQLGAANGAVSELNRMDGDHFILKPKDNEDPEKLIVGFRRVGGK